MYKTVPVGGGFRIVVPLEEGDSVVKLLVLRPFRGGCHMGRLTRVHYDDALEKVLFVISDFLPSPGLSGQLDLRANIS